MVKFRSEGRDVDIPDESVRLLVGRYRHDPPIRAYLLEGSLYSIDERPEDILGRLRLAFPLVQFNRTNGTPVWIKAAAATSIEPPIGMSGTVIRLSSWRQGVK